MRIKELPKSERPREKALQFGIESLSDRELLAIIIGSGVKNQSALEIANSLLSNYGSFSNLKDANIQSLKNQFGINKISALKLVATFEFYKRLISTKYVDELLVHNCDDLYKYFRYLENYDHEVFLLIMMNKNNKVIKQKEIYKGTDSFIELNLREIIVELLQSNAQKYALIHNHPNGEKGPSKEDIIATEEIKNACKTFGLIFFDHLIIYKGGFYSFKNKKCLHLEH